MATSGESFEIPKECWAGVVKNEGPGELILQAHIPHTVLIENPRFRS